MMPYEVGKTFIIRVPLLSIETYKELCSEKDNDAFIRKCYANDVLMESIAILRFRSRRITCFFEKLH